jgi:TonB family protein
MKRAPSNWTGFNVSCLVLLISGALLPSWPASAQAQWGTTNTCEVLGPASGVRMHATRTILPEYPQDAIRSKVTGVVVAEVCIPAGGRVASIQSISSAPSKAIAESVRKALSQWRFWTVFENGRHYPYGGKIIFYFVEQKGEFKVLEPGDEFYVGPHFALKQQRPLGPR